MRAGEVEPATPALLNSSVTGPEPSLDVVGQRRVRVAVAHVEDGGHDVGDARELLFGGSQGIDVDVDDGDLHAYPGERPSDAEPDALGAAGHERDAPVELVDAHYGFLLSVAEWPSAGPASVFANLDAAASRRAVRRALPASSRSGSSTSSNERGIL